MATVRIYKVAEVLGVPSREVLALLKTDHGIELKSASSTLEEVVARSFVERTARERKISLPTGDIFSGKATAKGPKGGKKSALAKKAEPPQPAVPVLGPPRLVKTIRPPAPPPTEDEAGDEPTVDAAATPDDASETEGVVSATGEAVSTEDTSLSAEGEDTAEPTDAAVESSTPDTPAAGRFIPPTLRLRIEEPGQTPQRGRRRRTGKQSEDGSPGATTF